MIFSECFDDEQVSYDVLSSTTIGGRSFGKRLRATRPRAPNPMPQDHRRRRSVHRARRSRRHPWSGGEQPRQCAIYDSDICDSLDSKIAIVSSARSESGNAGGSPCLTGWFPPAIRDGHGLTDQCLGVSQYVMWLCAGFYHYLLSGEFDIHYSEKIGALDSQFDQYRIVLVQRPSWASGFGTQPVSAASETPVSLDRFYLAAASHQKLNRCGK